LTMIFEHENLKMIINKKNLLLVLALSFAFKAGAENLGIRGAVFNILEQPFIQMMQSRLAKIDVSAMEQSMTKGAQQRINRPKGINFSEAEEDRVFYFDPTYVLLQDAKLPCGKILHKAGASVNPLDYISLERCMYFIDGTLPHQVAWLKERLENDKGGLIQNRVILVAGSVFEVQKTLGSELQDIVFFDQAGELSRKFGIKASPAIAMQEGKMIRIEEKKLEG